MKHSLWNSFGVALIFIGWGILQTFLSTFPFKEICEQLNDFISTEQTFLQIFAPLLIIRFQARWNSFFTQLICDDRWTMEKEKLDRMKSSFNPFFFKWWKNRFFLHFLVKITRKHLIDFEMGSSSVFYVFSNENFSKSIDCWDWFLPIIGSICSFLLSWERIEYLHRWTDG